MSGETGTTAGRDRRGGRPRKLSPQAEALVWQQAKDGVSLIRLAADNDVDPKTIRNIVERIDAELAEAS